MFFLIYMKMESQIMLLKNKVAIITGGAGVNGLGFASARMMAAQGARVVILDLERANPAAAAASLGDQHMGVQLRKIVDKGRGVFKFANDVHPLNLLK